VIIDKRTHPAIHPIREIRDGKNKKFIFCEGEKVLQELLRSKAEIESIYLTPDWAHQLSDILQKTKHFFVSERVMAFISDVTTPQGIITVARRPASAQPLSVPAKTPLILLLHKIQLPQNVGALFRTAEGAGVTEVWVTSQSCDPFGPKSIRGSSGSVLRMPVVEGLSIDDAVALLKKNKIMTVGAFQEAIIDYDKFDWKVPVALVMGSEGAGFDDREQKLFDEAVRIPMRGEVESLNVGIAAAVCLFEAARQRRI
jgi:TrmH family RNA methyltransferase